jgi:hypothetical protein
VVQGVVIPFGDIGHAELENFLGVAGLKPFCGRIITPMGSVIQHLKHSDVWCANK